MKKLTRQKLDDIIKEEIKSELNEEFTDEEYREITDIIRLELAQVFYDLYKKRRFWN
jgi:hypothetical protein